MPRWTRGRSTPSCGSSSASRGWWPWWWWSERRVSRRTAETHERIKEEIAREKAAALGRAGERFEAALATLDAIAGAWRAASAARERERLTAEYEIAWRAADAARMALLIQREAVGLRDQRVVDQQFPRPPRRL